MYETRVLVPVRKAGLEKLTTDENMCKTYAPMIAKEIRDVYTGQNFHVSIANFEKVDVNLSKQRKIGAVANAAEEIVWTNDKCN